MYICICIGFFCLSLWYFQFSLCYRPCGSREHWRGEAKITPFIFTFCLEGLLLTLCRLPKQGKQLAPLWPLPLVFVVILKEVNCELSSSMNVKGVQWSSPLEIYGCCSYLLIFWLLHPFLYSLFFTLHPFIIGLVLSCYSENIHTCIMLFSEWWKLTSFHYLVTTSILSFKSHKLQHFLVSLSKQRLRFTLISCINLRVCGAPLVGLVEGVMVTWRAAYCDKTD